SLQFNQRRRHHQKVAGDRDVQLLHDAQVTQILVSDASYGNVINTDVLLPNEVQQQIQWAFKLTEQDLQIVCVIISDDVRNCARDIEWRGTLFRNLLRVIFVHRQVRIYPRDKPVFSNTWARVTLAIPLAFSDPWS